ncbi:MAG: UDP-3-O-(3-hydroxymyristoyl) glucosamine N-acyltransferase [Lewinellaceae bacterium]|nr:UDP-3-O-(3-hydroxymyristoyl) glucosamine N-acyltransferase [Lewinellaceae bacterium]
MRYNSDIFLQVLNKKVDQKFRFSQLGLSNSTNAMTLSFLDDVKYIDQVNQNENIMAVITNTKFVDKLNKQYIVQSEDPRFDFYTLYNYLGKLEYIKTPSIIDKTVTIHPTAYVSEHNVKIGPNTVIYPNVTILADVEIGADCIVQSGTIIGSEGFEYKKTQRGILGVFHDGKVIIKDKVHIGANNCIDKGFSIRNTIIEEEVKIDNLIHVAHGVHIKRGAFIIAGTILGGSSTIDEEAWISINTSIAPGLVVGKHGFVSMGAVVTKSVPDNAQVTGNFAIPHDQFINDLKNRTKKN